MCDCSYIYENIVPPIKQGVKQPNIRYTFCIMTQPPLAFQPPDTRIRIRPVRLSDAESLFTNCWPSRSFRSVYDLVLAAQRAAADAQGLGVVVEGADHNLQAYGQFMVWPTSAEINDLIVAAPYRGQGLGTAIIQYLVAAARKLKIRRIEIGAAVSNPRAVTLYRRLGFEDSHTLLLNLGSGKEQVLFLGLDLRP
jgi:ribosomal protein S18 acetylase RimI-like enzyme